jgi:hypothetical protein
MPDVAPTTPATTAPAIADLRAAWRVARLSVAWTLLASVMGLQIGVRTGSGVLVAFSAIGFVDAIGASAIASHFGRAVRQQRNDDGMEEFAHEIVVFGLVAIGFGTVLVETSRLFVGAHSKPSLGAVVLMATSVVVLSLLAVRGRAIADRVSSAALRADSNISAVGAGLAGIALVGIALTQLLGLDSADALAAILVGGIAIVVGIRSGLEEGALGPAKSAQFTVLAFILMIAVAAFDAVAGSGAGVIGLLVIGPACAAVTLNPRSVLTVTLGAVGLAVALGFPDGIWATTKHFGFTVGIAAFGVVAAVVVAVVAPYIELAAVHDRAADTG